MRDKFLNFLSMLESVAPENDHAVISGVRDLYLQHSTDGLDRDHPLITKLRLFAERLPKYVMEMRMSDGIALNPGNEWPEADAGRAGLYRVAKDIIVAILSAYKEGRTKATIETLETNDREARVLYWNACMTSVGIFNDLGLPATFDSDGRKAKRGLLSKAFRDVFGTGKWILTVDLSNAEDGNIPLAPETKVYSFGRGGNMRSRDLGR